MNMKIGIAIVIVVIVAAVGFYFAQSGMLGTESPAPVPAAAPTSTPEPVTGPQASPDPTPPSQVSPPPAATEASVSISGFTFGPAELRVKKGTKVTWTNLNLSGHTITSDNGAFASGNLSQGKTFSHTFNTAGTFTYHCALHPSMTGTVIVE
jgi:plastocyanin